MPKQLKAILLGCITYLAFFAVLQSVVQLSENDAQSYLINLITTLLTSIMFPVSGYVAGRVVKNGGLVVGACVGALIALVSAIVMLNVFGSVGVAESDAYNFLVLLITYSIPCSLGGAVGELYSGKDSEAMAA